ncbi:hypothetical protein GCM10010340_30270 [Streptomyces griseoloalbus]|nr:hypothetical protein GCM10010340_30270 [Streptomyces albaduncus]
MARPAHPHPAPGDRRPLPAGAAVGGDPMTILAPFVLVAPIFLIFAIEQLFAWIDRKEHQ